MKELNEEHFKGERALFMSRNLKISDSIFSEGESPLKESSSIEIKTSSFQWKYPLWYCKDINIKNTVFFENARAGIWYSKNIFLEDCFFEAPKGFRKSENISLNHVEMPNALETFWQCKNITLNNVTAKGDYFGMNCQNIKIDGFSIAGNYSFDSCKNIEIKNAKMLSKDAFWNCENVKMSNSYIAGEYIGWNSKNVEFIDCTIESLQGFCYMENVKLINCKLLNTNLAFEYSTVEADISTEITSIKNPIAGTIKCKKAGEIIFDDPKIDSNNTKIIFTHQDKNEL